MNTIDSDTNPYAVRATASVEVPARNSLRFDGVITDERFRRMMLSGMESLLVWVLIALLSIVLVPMVLVFAFGILVEKDTAGALPAMLGISVYSALMFACVQIASRRIRARRILKQYPDLLSVARGTIDDRGLVFYDGKCTHWFSWSQLRKIQVDARGIRVPVDENPNRFLALTSDLFDAYDAEDAKETIRQFSVITIPIDERNRCVEKAFDLSLAEEGYFCGITTYELPNTLLTIASNTGVRMIAGAVILAFGLLLDHGLALKWAQLVLGTWIVVSAFVNATRFRFAKRLVHKNQFGWVGAFGLILGADGYTTFYPANTFTAFETHATAVQLTFDGRMSIPIYRELFKDESHWSKALASAKGFVAIRTCVTT